MNDVHALSGAYALDAVTDAERSAFERHMAGCGACREEVASLRETAAHLSSLTVEEPPAALRGSVLEAITTVRQLPPRVQEPASQPRRRPARSLMAAAAAVVLLGGVAVGVTQPWRDDPGQSQVAVTAAQVLNAEDATEVTQTFEDGARATVVRSEELGRAVLVTHDMPNAPRGHRYVVWLQQGEEMVHAAVMPQGADNTVLLDGDAATASGAGVTVETDPNTAAPTTDPIALFAF